TYTLMGIKLDVLQRMRKQGYSIIGLSPAEPESLPILAGNELKSLRQGRLVLNAEMVAFWKAVQDQMNELRAEGAKPLDEIAQDLGISMKEARWAERQLHKQKLQAEGKSR